MILSEIQQVIKKSHLGINLTIEDLNKTEVPEWFNLLAIKISNEDSLFIRDCYLTINSQSNFLKIKQQFMITVLTENEKYYDINKFKDVYDCTQTVIELWKLDPERKDQKKWEAVAYSAASAASAAAPAYSSISAANSVAYSASNSTASIAYAANSAASTTASTGSNTWAEDINKRTVELQHILLKIVKEYSV